MTTTDEPDRPIARRLPFLLNRLVSVMVEGTAPDFRDHGLSIPAARTLARLLDEGGATTVGKLSDGTSIDLSTTSHILRRMQRFGYVERERQADDNRVVVVRLTERGLDVARQCLEASLRHEAVLIRGLSESEVATLKRLLEQAYVNARDGFSR